MHGLFDRIEEAKHLVEKVWSGKPTIGIILGTGLGSLATEIDTDVSLPYGEIPHFPISTVESHAGRLVCGRLGDVPVIAMEGRFHLYEGYSPQEITFPVRLMKAMGCSTLIVSNACGGVNPRYSAGDIMLIEDHINLLPNNPLIGVNDDRLGPRFPDMSEPYCKKLLDECKRIALAHKIAVQCGVYVAVTGPNLETRAEYRFLKAIGADVVGMSTVPECIVARHSGMKVLGFSVVTDMCLPDALEEAEISKILAVAASAEPKLRILVREAVKFIGSKGLS